MGQHGYTVRSNPFFIIHRGKPDLCYLQCVDTMLIRSNSTEGYFILMLGIEKSFIVSLMMELFLTTLDGTPLALRIPCSGLIASSPVLRIEYILGRRPINSMIIFPLHSSLNRLGVFLFALIFSSPKVWRTGWSTDRK